MENNNTPGKFEIIPALLKEMEEEIMTTRKMLALVPDDKLDWQPHPKSMNMKTLAVHIAELPSWVKMGLTTDELDFAKMDWTPKEVSGHEALLEILEGAYQEGRTSLTLAQESDLKGSWVLRTGDHIHARMTRYEIIRHSFQQTTHHRAQLGVYLRLLDIPIPGSYGPSADDTNF